MPVFQDCNYKRNHNTHTHTHTTAPPSDLKNDTMKIYVAGKFGMGAELDAIRHVQTTLVAAGHSIAHDWTRVEGTAEQGTWPADRRRVFRALCAKLDIDGVRAADAVVVLMDDCAYSYRGTWTEIGAALGLGKRIIIIAPAALRLSEGMAPPLLQAATNCFFEHESIEHVDTLEDAVKALACTI